MSLSNPLDQLVVSMAVMSALTLVVLVAIYSSAGHSSARSAVTVDPEVYMDSTQLITSKGYPCENHYATTEDGFILNMQRIPRGQSPKGVKDPSPVVFLQHGLEASSSNWLDNLANESLAYLLYDAGADVWLGNVRGNMYSRNHTKLKPDQEEFWAWSWDEMAAYDLPAMLDYVTRTTGQKQVHYVGHSQGTLIGFAGFTSNKTLAAMVKQFYALAPVAKVHHIESPIRLLAPFAKDIAAFYELLGRGEFLQYNRKLMDFLAKYVCTRLGEYLCENVLFVLGGTDSSHLNITRVPVYVAHNPGGTSVQNILHFAQGVNIDAFQKFDFGSAAENTIHYNQSTPPTYQLEDLTVPTVAYTGGRDSLADPDDCAWLLSHLPASILRAHLSFPEWEHLDFIWAYDASKLCYSDIIKRIFTAP